MRCTDSLLEDQWMMAFVPEIRLLVMTLGGSNQMYNMYFKADLRGKSHHIKKKKIYIYIYIYTHIYIYIHMLVFHRTVFPRQILNLIKSFIRLLH